MNALPLQEIIGKSVTAVYSVIEAVENDMESARVFIELDHNLTIEIPAAGAAHVAVVSPPENADNLFDNLDDFPVFYLDENAPQKTAESNFRKIFRRVGSIFFITMGDGSEIGNYKVEWEENKLKHVKGQRINDLLFYPGTDEKAFLLLENGYLVSETARAPKSSGLAGLNIYDSLNDLKTQKGNGIISAFIK